MRNLIFLVALVLHTLAADPKKGVGCAKACNAGTLQSLQISWYYNWEVRPAFSTPYEYLPMCYSLNKISQLPNYSTHLLGFNEPDNVNESNIAARDAAAAWPELVKRSATIASPAMAADPNKNPWLVNFYNAAGGSPKVDHIAIHHYGSNIARLK